MTKEKENGFTVEQLRKRKKFGSALLAILIIVVVLSASLVLYGFLLGNELNTALLVSAIACLMTSLPIYLGIRKIDLALSNKGDA